ncbi:hypothetical protein BDZ45DRAFT_799176 [Acephala macrosclerotiorum]|nr:hypothetical protein BDZ45DRAFT_799176 [Acephala macrosclerotiorum]
MKGFLTGKPSKKNDGEGSGRNGISEYISQINDFLDNVEGKSFSMFQRREDPLGDMLSWGKHMYRERSRVEHNMNMQGKALRRADEKIEEMQKLIDTLEFDCGKLRWEKDQLMGEHTSQLSDIAKRHSLYEGQRDDEVKDLREAHRKNVERINKDHQNELGKLVGQLLVNQKDDQGWPDDKMGVKFRELQRLMESVTAPRNKEFLIPAGQKLPSRLDSTNFLGRVGTGKSHFLLKSTLWAIIREQFFSSPFGFGVLGPGKSKRQLFEMYAAWRKLFDANAVASSPDHEDYAVFRQDGLANTWRSTTFMYINVALTSPEQNHSPVARLNTENFNDTVSRILAVLSEVAGLSHASVRPDIQDQVRQMVLLGRDIALQFGINPSQMELVVPKHGEKIKIGEKFHDCEDGDSFKGKTHDVDLVTAPGLQKIGDGRSDMNSQRAMVPCEIYPIETED